MLESFPTASPPQPSQYLSYYPEFPWRVKCDNPRCVTSVVTIKRSNGRSIKAATTTAAIADSSCLLGTADGELLIVDLSTGIAHDLAVHLTAHHAPGSGATSGLSLALPTRTAIELKQLEARDVRLSPDGKQGLISLHSGFVCYFVCRSPVCEPISALNDVQITSVCWGLLPDGSSFTTNEVLIGTARGQILLWRTDIKTTCRCVVQLPRPQAIRGIVAASSGDQLAVLVSSPSQLFLFHGTVLGGLTGVFSDGDVASHQLFEVPWREGPLLNDGALGELIVEPPTTKEGNELSVWWLTRVGVAVSCWAVQSGSGSSVTMPMLLGFQSRRKLANSKEQTFFRKRLDCTPAFHRLYCPSSSYSSSNATSTRRPQGHRFTLGGNPNNSSPTEAPNTPPPVALSFALCRSFLLLLYEDRLALCSRVTREELTYMTLPHLQFGRPRRFLRSPTDPSVVLLLTSKHLLQVNLRESKSQVLRDLIKAGDYSTAVVAAANAAAAAASDTEPLDERIPDAVRAEFAKERFLGGALEDAAKLYAACQSVPLEDTLLRFSRVSGVRRFFLLLGLLESCKQALRSQRRLKGLSAKQLQPAQVCLRLWQICLALAGAAEHGAICEWWRLLLRQQDGAPLNRYCKHQAELAVLVGGQERFVAKYQQAKEQRKRLSTLTTAIQQELRALLISPGEGGAMLMLAPLRHIFLTFGCVPEALRYMSFIGDVEGYAESSLLMSDDHAAYASIARLPNAAAQASMLTRFGAFLLRRNPFKFCALLVAPGVLEAKIDTRVMEAAFASAEGPTLPGVESARSPLWEALSTKPCYSIATMLAVILAEPCATAKTSRAAAAATYLLQRLFSGSPEIQGDYIHTTGFCDGYGALWNLWLNLLAARESQEVLMAALKLLDKRRTAMIVDVPTLLWSCLTYDKLAAAVFLLGAAGFHHQAVELALLRKDFPLAAAAGRRLPTTASQMARRCLWTRIAHAAAETLAPGELTELMEAADPSLEFSVLLRTCGSGVLVGNFRDAICAAFEKTEQRIQQRTKEMETNRATLKRLRKGLMAQKNRTFIESIRESTKCLYCRTSVVIDRFYAFPCGHACHCTCAHQLKFRRLVGARKAKYIGALKRLSKAVLNPEMATGLPAAEKEIDAVLAEECYICGPSAAHCISEPFLTAEEMAVLLDHAEVSQ